MFSQDLVRYNTCKFVDPNTLSNYDIADHSWVFPVDPMENNYN